jgi:GxxExxY protein
MYKGLKLDCGYRLDVIVNDSVVIELKSVEQILPIHQAQLMTYLRLSGKKVGLLINFNVAVLKNGISEEFYDYFYGRVVGSSYLVDLRYSARQNCS